MILSKHAHRGTGRHVLVPGVLPALLLGCFARTPLHAQAAAPQPAVAQAQKGPPDGAPDQAGATVNHSTSRNESDTTSAIRRVDAAADPLADYTRLARNRAPAANFGIGASYDHKSGAPGEDLKFDLRYTGQNNSTVSSVLYDYRRDPTPFIANSLRSTDRRNRILDVSVDYERNLEDAWHLKAGAKVADSRNNNPTDYLAQDPVTDDYVPVPGRITDFASNDRNAAVYGILSTKLFTHLSLQGGLRGEYTRLDVRQPLLNEEDKYDYMNWLPSFYATRDIGTDGMLQLRAARRIARPNERDLNPHLGRAPSRRTAATTSSCASRTRPAWNRCS